MSETFSVDARIHEVIPHDFTVDISVWVLGREMSLMTFAEPRPEDIVGLLFTLTYKQGKSPTMIQPLALAPKTETHPYSPIGVEFTPEFDIMLCRQVPSTIYRPA